MANTQNQQSNKSGGKRAETTTTTSRKKLKKLRSIKVANLDRLRVSMRRLSSRIDDRRRLIALSVHGEEAFAGVKESWPRYMMATSSSSARTGSSLASPGTRAAKSLKRMTSSKRFRRMTSLRSRKSSSGRGVATTTFREQRRDESNASSVRHDSALQADAMLLNNGNESEEWNEPENEDIIVREAVKLKGRLEKSRSIKLTRIRSMRSSRRQLKIRLGQASDSISEDTQPNKNAEKSARNPSEKWSMKPPKFLAKLPSLRSKRSTIKKSIDTKNIDRATCSSTLKSSKMSEHLELKSGGCESDGISEIHVCPYSYCSLNGHYHAPLPPLSAFISAKRQSLRTKKNMDVKNEEEFSVESGPSSKTTSTASCEERLEEFNAASSKGYTVREQGSDKGMVADSEMELNETDHRGGDLGFSSLTYSEATMEKDETTSSQILIETPTENCNLGDSGCVGTNILFDDQKYTKMWHLIYHVVFKKGQTKTEQDNGEIGEEIKSEANTVIAGNDIGTSNRNTEIDDEAGKKNPDIEFDRLELDRLKAFTIKLVQDAVDDILSIHESPCPQQSFTTLDHDTVKGNVKERDPTAQDLTKQLDNMYTVNKVEVESREKNLPKETAENGYRKLKKLIASMRFIKDMEKPRKIGTHRQGYLSGETNTEAEAVHLKRIDIDERKNLEEWMLDYALRKVIAKLGPAEQRRVALLVEAFETVAPEPKGMNTSHPMRTKSTDKAAIAIIEYEEGGNFLGYDNAQDDVSKRPDTNNIAFDRNSPLETGVQEDHGAMISSSTKHLSDNRFKSNVSFNLHTHNQASPTGCIVCDPSGMMKDKDKTKSEPKSEELQQDYQIKHPEQDETNINTKDTVLSKQNYTSLWHLIYLHALSGTSTEAGSKPQEVKTVGDQDSDGSIFSEGDTEARGETFDSEVERRIELTQSNTIQLVKDALEGILQSESSLSKNQSQLAPTRLYQKLPDEKQGTDDTSDTSIATASANDSHQEEQERVTLPLEVDNESFLANITTPFEENKNAPAAAAKPQSKALQGFSKIRKAILCNKFIRAMEKTQKFHWQKRRVLPTEPDFEAESVSLRRCLINQRKNSEEWMLDYALQQAIAKLDPDKKRRVALIARAFEGVNPDLGETSKGVRATGATVADSDSSDDKVDGKQEQMDGIHDLDLMQDGNLKDPESMIQYDPACVMKGKDETEYEPMSEALQQKSRTNHLEQDLTNINTKGTRLSKQNYTSLWHLIYLHAQSGTTTEAGSQSQEVKTVGEGENDGITFSKGDTNANEEAFDSEVESIELTQSDTIQLVKEALEGILLGQSSSTEKQSRIAAISVHPKFSDESKGTDETSDVPFVTTLANVSHQEEKDRLDLQPEADKESLSRDITTPSQENKNASRETARPETKAQQGFTKMRKAILCNKFIRAMEKTQKVSWQKQRALPIEPGFEAENVLLRRCLVNQRKNSEEWMLDYALQQAIAKLDPDKQRRVALIARAFEKVNPDLGGTRTGIHATKATAADSDSSDDNVNGKKDQMHGICDLDLKQDGNPVPCIMKNPVTRVQVEACEVREPYLHVNDSAKVDKPPGNDVSENTATTRPNDGEEPTSTKAKILQADQLQDLQRGRADKVQVSIAAKGYARQLNQPEDCTEASDVSAQPENIICDDVSPKSDEINCNVSAQTEDKEDAHNASVVEKDCQDQNADIRSDIITGTGKYSRMWHLIYQHARSIIPEKLEAQIQGSEIEVHPILDDAEQEPERSSGDSSQSSSEADCETDHEIPSSGSSNRDIQQQKKDAIMVVQKAVEQILVIQEQACNDHLTNNMTNSNNEARSCTSDRDGVAALRGEKDMPTQGSDNDGESSSTTYNKLSQVILVKRFIKAMEKMRKLNRWRAQHISPKSQRESEHVKLKQHALSERKSCEDWMLDYALQEVIGKLAPIQRKRVAMLVEAFETVSPLSAPGTRQRLNAAAS
ncbi:Calmodulin binding protein PICBP-like protein [Drosera capensis]